MIKNVVSIELDHKGKRYQLVCDFDCPIDDVRDVLAHMDKHMSELLEKLKPSIVEDNLPESDVCSELPEGCCGKTLC